MKPMVIYSKEEKATAATATLKIQMQQMIEKVICEAE